MSGICLTTKSSFRKIFVRPVGLFAVPPHRFVGPGAYTSGLHISLVGGNLSWHATAFVKNLTHHKDGTRLSAREKLILFVLADSHNVEQGNCAWLSVPKAAMAALTSERRFSALLQRLESKGTLRIQRREGRSNLYFFPGLDTPAKISGVKKLNCGTPPLELQHPTPATAVAPIASIEPLGTDIQPASRPSDMSLILKAIEESRKQKRPADDILKELRGAA